MKFIKNDYRIIYNFYNDLDNCFTSVSDGKSLVASAITDKGVETASDATFEVLAENIGNISGVTDRNFSFGFSLSLNLQTPGYNNDVPMYFSIARSNGQMSVICSQPVQAYISNTDVGHLWFNWLSYANSNFKWT